MTIKSILDKIEELGCGDKAEVIFNVEGSDSKCMEYFCKSIYETSSGKTKQVKFDIDKRYKNELSFGDVMQYLALTGASGNSDCFSRQKWKPGTFIYLKNSNGFMTIYRVDESMPGKNREIAYYPFQVDALAKDWYLYRSRKQGGKKK